jgi:hypothetical protein
MQRSGVRQPESPLAIAADTVLGLPTTGGPGAP